MTQTIDNLFGASQQATPEQEKSLAFLGSQYLLLDLEVQNLMRGLVDLKSRRDQAEEAMLTALAQAKLKSVRLDSGQVLTGATKWQFALPPKADQEKRNAALLWLRRIGFKDLIEPSIHPQTLTAIMRERKEDGKVISPLLREVEMKYLSVRKE